MKKIFQRTCMGCNIKKDKKDLLRVALNKNGDICVDKTNKADGRGFYICNNIKCLENMVKTKRLNRMLKKI